MSNSSEFCGDHVNLFRGFLARMSHPNKLPVEGKFSEVHTHNPAYSPDRVPLIGPGEWKFSRKFSVASRYCLLLFAVPFVSM
jgi:hypothetical protein